MGEGENNIILGTGLISIDGQPFARGDLETIYELDAEDSVDAPPAWPKENPFVDLSASMSEISFALQMTANTAERLADVFFGLTEAVTGVCRGIDRRVAHLALFGRKARTRKKNRRRAFRILERETKR